MVKYGKQLWYLAEQAAVGIIWQAFVTGSPIQPAQSDAGDPTASIWTRWKFQYDDTVSLDTADALNFKIDIANDTAGTLDSSWTPTDLSQVATVLSNLVSALQAFIPQRYRCTKVTAYRMAFMPLGNLDDQGRPGPAFAESGPPIHQITPNAQSGNLGHMPGQVRGTVSFRTPSRANWGRLYLPSFHDAHYSAGGRLLNATVTSVASIFNDTVSALDANDFYVVVPTTSVNKQSVRTLQNVTAVAMDDVPDVQRRGRPHQALFHSIYPAPAELDATLPAEDSVAAA